jgi:uncharacterized protein YndB with AHSA1/START domain
MTERKPEKSIELSVDIDAPLEAAWEAVTTGQGIANWFAPIAQVSGPGEGGTVTAGWSDDMMMSNTVVAWEPNKHVRWMDDSGWMGEGTALALDYHLSTENGKTRVRLVQSAFGPNEGWDDFLDGVKTGWTYFLANLRVYLERLAGRTRRMITERIKVDGPRMKFWRHLTSEAGGLVVGQPGPLKIGDSLKVKLQDAPVGAVVEMLVEGQGIGLRIPELTHALLFVELEGKADTFHTGYWFSVYDEAQAKALEAPAKRAFQRVHESLAK